MLHAEMEVKLKELRIKSRELSIHISDNKAEGKGTKVLEEQLRGINHEITYLVAIWKGNVDGSSLK